MALPPAQSNRIAIPDVGINTAMLLSLSGFSPKSVLPAARSSLGASYSEVDLASTNAACTHHIVQISRMLHRQDVTLPRPEGAVAKKEYAQDGPMVGLGLCIRRLCARCSDSYSTASQSGTHQTPVPKFPQLGESTGTDIRASPSIVGPWCPIATFTGPST